MLSIIKNQSSKLHIPSHSMWEIKQIFQAHNPVLHVAAQKAFYREKASHFSIGEKDFRTPLLSENLIKYFRNWASQLTPDERMAIKNYTWRSFHSINKILRGTATFDPFTTNNAQEMIERIHAALQKSTLPESMTVYRKTSPFALIELAPDGITSMTDKILPHKSFMSTSLNPNLLIHDSMVCMKLTLPEGLNASYLGPLSLFDNEDEVLVDMNQKIRITDVRKEGWFTFLEGLVLPPEEPKSNHPMNEGQHHKE